MIEGPRPITRHIALYIPSLGGGGAERVMVMLANGFAARGHRVDLVLASATGPYLSDVSADVHVVDLASRRVLSSLLPLARYMRHARPDAVLSALDYANILAVWAKRLAGTGARLVVSERSTPSQNSASGSFGWIMHRLMQCFYSQADAVVTVSKGVEQEMVDLFGLPRSKLITINNPLDIDRIHRLMHEQFTHPWFESGEVPVILAVGRLNAAKDYPTLLRAMKLLLKRRQAKLVILGQGERETALMSLAHELDIVDHIDLVGFKKNPYTWMRRCDLFVMSSAWEGWPGALMEALACGANIISTDCANGPREILEDGRWGRLVPVGDAPALAAAMGDALDNPVKKDARERLHKVRSEFIIESYESVLLALK